MTFENLYMSHSMHELFNKSGLPTAEEIAALAVIALAKMKERHERFTFEAMLAAAESYSNSAVDLGIYATSH
jgi:hypothetical protein